MTEDTVIGGYTIPKGVCFKGFDFGFGEGFVCFGSALLGLVLV